MRTHLSYLAIIAAFLFFGWTGYKTLNKKKAEIDRLESNVSALIADTTEKAAKLVLTKSELAQVSQKAYDKVKSIEDKQGGKVREIHVIKYLPSSVVHDTLFLPDTSTLRKIRAVEAEYNWCYQPMVWEFNHGCVTNVVTYDPFNSGITDSLFGEVSIDRYVLAQKPRWIVFKPRMWNSRNWPTSVRVENNCGLEIKENTIFEVK